MNPTTKALIERVNQITTTDDPRLRIKFVSILANHIGTLMLLPPIVLEQLLTKLEHELEQYSGMTDPDIAIANTIAERRIKMLRAFLYVRPAYIEELRRILPDAVEGLEIFDC